jgi:hypothetical protein
MSQSPNTPPPVTPFIIRLRSRLRKIGKVIYIHVGVPIIKFYHKIHDNFSKWWSELIHNNCDDNNDNHDGNRRENECHDNIPPSSPSSLKTDGSPLPCSPTSIRIDTYSESSCKNNDMDLHNRSSVTFHDTLKKGDAVEITDAIERELSETSVMRISHSNSISSLIRENYVDSSGNNEVD